MMGDSISSDRTTSVRYTYIQDSEDLPLALAAISSCVPRILAVDTETSGLHSYRGHQLIIMQLYHPNVGSIILDCRRLPHELLAEQLRSLLSSSRWLKILHNAAFDLAFIKSALGLEVERVFDTMLAERTLTAGTKSEVSLDAVARRRLGRALDKSNREEFPNLGDADLSPALLEYCAQDVEVLPEIMLLQSRQLEQVGLLAVAQLEFQVVPAIVEAHLTGVLIDRPRWQRHLVYLKTEADCAMDELQAELQPHLEQNREREYARRLVTYEKELARYEYLLNERATERSRVQANCEELGLSKGETKDRVSSWSKEHRPPRKPPMPKRTAGTINLGSVVQLQAAFTMMGIPLPKNKDGRPKTDHNALAPLAKDHVVIARVLKWRETNKLITAFGENILGMLDNEERLHPDFKQYGADTGRMACANPNVQQMPKNGLGGEFRRCFVAPPGSKLVSADYSQIELRILHELAEQGDTISAINSGLDLHSLTASQLFDVPYEEVVAEKNGIHMEKRQMAKTVNFGVVYGETEWGLARSLEIPLADANKYIDKYFLANPGVRQWLDQAAAFGLEHLYVQTPLGRKRYFERNPHNPRFDRRAYEREKARKSRAMTNHPIQGASADITKQAIVFIREALKREQLEARFQLFVHDEIVMLAPEGQADLVASVMVREMKRAGELFLKRVKVEVEYWIGDTWSHS